MKLSKRMSRRAFFGLAAGSIAYATFGTKKAHAFTNCMPSIGPAVGRIIARVPGEAIAGVWERWQAERNEDSEQDMNEAAALYTQMADAQNSTTKAVADAELRRKTEPLKNLKNQKELSNTWAAHMLTETASQDSFSKALDQATLTMAAPFISPGVQAKYFEKQFGDTWYQTTTYGGNLFSNKTLTGRRAKLADAFILNVTAPSAKVLANTTSAWGKSDALLYEQSSRSAAFTLAKAPLIRQRQYTTKSGAESERDALQQHISHTYASPSWRKMVKELPSEVQGLQICVQQAAVNNMIKKERLRELEVQLAIRGATALENLRYQS